MNRKSALVRWFWAVIEAVTLIGIGLVLNGWPLVKEVWLVNKIAIFQAVGLFALLPLAFVGTIALDRRLASKLKRGEVEQ